MGQFVDNPDDRGRLHVGRPRPGGIPRNNVVWYYKVDTDPEVEGIAPNGWKDYDYVISTNSIRTYRRLTDRGPRAEELGRGGEVRRRRRGGERCTAFIRTGERRRGRIEDLDRLDRIAADKPWPAAMHCSCRALSVTLLVRGRVDARMLLGLRRATSLGTVTVGAIPSMAGEEEARRPRRQLRVTGSTASRRRSR